MAARDEPLGQSPPIAKAGAPFVRLVRLDSESGALDLDPWEIWCLDLEPAFSSLQESSPPGVTLDGDLPQVVTLTGDLERMLARFPQDGQRPSCVIGAVRGIALANPGIAEIFRRQVAENGIILHELAPQQDLAVFVTDLQDRLRQIYRGPLHPETMTRPRFVPAAFDVYADHHYEATDDMRDLIGAKAMYAMKRLYLFARRNFRTIYRSLAPGTTAI